MTHDCKHPQPAPFGSSDITWDSGGLSGTVFAPCKVCGEWVSWAVTR